MDGSARPGVTAIRVAKHTQVTNHFISPALSKQSIAYVSFDVGRDHITEKDFKPDHAIANNRSPCKDETTRALKSMLPVRLSLGLVVIARRAIFEAAPFYMS